MRIATLLLGLLLGGSATAQEWTHDPWTPLDTGLQAVVLGTLLADWDQTRRARLVIPGHEDNAVLGAAPSPRRVNAYFASVALAHTGIAYILPSGARTIWQAGTIIVEFDAISQNKSVGIKVRLPL